MQTHLIQQYIQSIPEHTSVIKLNDSATALSKAQSRNYFVFKKIVKKILEEAEDDRLIGIDGHDIAASETYLSVDLLHPSDQGHILMGRRLAERMKGEN